MADDHTDSLVFVDAHHPPLTPGTYEVSVTHTIAEVGGSRISDTFASAARFHVLGPRTALEPGWIAGRFPPPHSTGDHAAVLPHVALTRSTLPWERTAQRGGDPGDPVPWMALLVLTDDEMSGGSGLPAATLHEVPGEALASSAPRVAGAPAFPGLDPEKGSSAAGPVRVLDVPRGHLEANLPEGEWLGSLAHVKERLVGQVAVTDAEIAALDAVDLTDALRSRLRALGCPLGPQVKVTAESLGAEWTLTDRDSGRTIYLERRASGGLLDVADEARAVVMACRATLPDTTYRAFLVSLDQRYVAGTGGLAFDYGTASGSGDIVRLVVLDSWTFAVDRDAGRLEHLMRGLFQEGTSAPVARDLTLAVPTEGKKGAGVDILRAGYALLPHHLRHGGQTRSWYRGPLVPERRMLQSAPSLPAVHSDQLLILDELYRMYDTSYAAAWELGRQMVLANREIALDLVAWKQTCRRALHQRSASPHHLPIRSVGPSGGRPDVPTSVGDFVERLIHLDGIPFTYLVPDPAMLPPESAKTFVVDHWWLYYLLDGVASVGRLHDRHGGEEANAFIDLHARAFRSLLAGGVGEQGHPRQVSGVLVRSEVVSGWPDLHIELYRPGSSDLLHPMRRVTLSDNVLLLLVDGPIGRIRMHPNLEALHHGIGEPGSRGVAMKSADVVDIAQVAATSTARAAAPLSPGRVGRTLMANGTPMIDVTLNSGASP